MRFQDCNGLLHGRIYDGVTCVLLHVAVEMFPWTLCFLSLGVVVLRISLNEVLRYSLLFLPFLKLLDHAHRRLVLICIAYRPNCYYHLWSHAVCTMLLETLTKHSCSKSVQYTIQVDNNIICAANL